MFATYKTGLEVNKKSPLTIFFSSSLNSIDRTALPASRTGLIFLSTSNSATAALSLVRATFSTRAYRLLMESRSAKTNSKLIVSISSRGATLLATWVMLSSSKARTTCTIASTCRMFSKNLFPSPSPLLAPLTIPAISVNSKVVWIILAAGISSSMRANRSSGTSTIPTLGSIVAKG